MRKPVVLALSSSLVVMAGFASAQPTIGPGEPSSPAAASHEASGERPEALSTAYRAYTGWDTARLAALMLANPAALDRVSVVGVYRPEDLSSQDWARVRDALNAGDAYLAENRAGAFRPLPDDLASARVNEMLGCGDCTASTDATSSFGIDWETVVLSTHTDVLDAVRAGRAIRWDVGGGGAY